MYETIRAYVVEQQVAIDRAALRERHRRFFVEEGLRLAAAVDGLDGARALARLAAEQENLLGAHEDALTANALPEGRSTRCSGSSRSTCGAVRTRRSSRCSVGRLSAPRRSACHATIAVASRGC